MSYSEDLKICEAATEGPWFVANWTDDAGHYFVEDGRQEGLYPIRCEGNEARYIAHFNPTYVTQLIKQAQRAEELETALRELFEAEWMVTHDWGGDRDSILLKVEELLK